MILKTDSLTLSVVGRVNIPSQDLSFRPFAMPEITLKQNHPIFIHNIVFLFKEKVNVFFKIPLILFDIYYIIYLTIFGRIFSMELKIKIIGGNKIPSYATSGSAGLDLSACIAEDITLKPMERAIIPTGIAVAVPEGYAGMVYARSGLAIKHGITLSNSVGVIDSDYRGEIKCGIVNLGTKPYTIRNGERIAQLILTPVAQAHVVPVDKLDETLRGEGGFGSTGK